MQVAKLFARIGVSGDSKKLDGFIGGLSKAKVMIAGIATAALAASMKIKEMTQEAMDSAAAYQQFKSETGASMTELQKWQNVAKATNNSSQAIVSGIKSIVANQEKIKLGEGNISGYQLLGIDPHQDPFKILEDLRDKTKDFSQSQKKEALSRLGLGAEFIQMLDLTKDQFNAMAGTQFIMSPGEIQLLSKARGSLQQVGSAIDFLKNQLASELAPGIIKGNEELVKFIKTHKDQFVKVLKTVFDWISKFTNAIKNSGLMIDRIIKNTIGWENAIKGLLAILAILNAGIIASPIGLLIAGLLLLIGVLDDLYVYSTGKGKSLFGVLMQKFPEFEKGLFGFLDKAKDSFELVKALFKGDEAGIENFVKKLGDLGVGIVALFELIKTAFNLAFLSIKTLLKPVEFIIKAIGELLSAFQGKQDFGKAIGKVKDLFVDEIITGNIENFKDFFGQAGKSIETVNNAFNVKIEVNSNQDPTMIAKETGKEFKNQVTAASQNRSRNQ